MSPKSKFQNNTVDRSLCRKCKHYYVTWDPKYPHGCRGFNMESKQHPGLVVQKNSGQECLLFEPKNKMNKKIQ